MAEDQETTTVEAAGEWEVARAGGLAPRRPAPRVQDPHDTLYGSEDLKDRD